MDRELVRVLLLAWERPEFRTGLRHLIDLDEVTTLLAALAVDDHDQQVERRMVELLRSALDTFEIRQAVLLLIESDEIRVQLGIAIVSALPQRPGLARSIRSALDDRRVRQELRSALDTAQLRDLIWQAAADRLGHRRWALARQVAFLLILHRSARKLARALRRHGLLAELRRRPASPARPAPVSEPDPLPR
jgi:hypothetical protein